jgi:nucleoid DNA-binding protein
MISLILSEIVRGVDAGERVELRGFGSFFPRERKATTGRNPRTGETLNIPASKRVVFKVGSKLKEAVNGK